MFVPPLTCVSNMFVPRGQTKLYRHTDTLTNEALYIYRRECLNVGKVLTFRIHNVGTVPTFEMHNVGTAVFYDTFKDQTF